jgi:hypothetical protein
MARSNDSSYGEWDDRISRRAKKAENKKNKKRINSNDIMERWSYRQSDDDEFYTDREKFRGR